MALAGVRVAVRRVVLPTTTSAVAGATVIPVTGTGATVTALVAVCPPSAVVTVMVVVPAVRAVSRPVSLTLATAG